MKDNQAKQLGQFIRKHREAHGISTRLLAQAVNVDKSQIIRLEQGVVQSPRADMLAAIAEQLDLSLADVFGLAGYAVPSELPSFRPYLRAKYRGLPTSAIIELEQQFRDITEKYGAGPLDGEDEQA